MGSTRARAGTRMPRPAVACSACQSLHVAVRMLAPVAVPVRSGRLWPLAIQWANDAIDGTVGMPRRPGSGSQTGCQRRAGPSRPWQSRYAASLATATGSPRVLAPSCWCCPSRPLDPPPPLELAPSCCPWGPAHCSPRACWCPRAAPPAQCPVVYAQALVRTPQCVLFLFQLPYMPIVPTDSWRAHAMLPAGLRAHAEKIMFGSRLPPSAPPRLPPLAMPLPPMTICMATGNSSHALALAHCSRPLRAPASCLPPPTVYLPPSAPSLPGSHFSPPHFPPPSFCPPPPAFCPLPPLGYRCRLPPSAPPPASRLPPRASQLLPSRPPPSASRPPPPTFRSRSG